MSDRNDKLKMRTKAFGLRVIRLVEKLPAKPAAKVIGHQLLRSPTSVGANYRAACRSRSSAEFRSRLAVVEEEADESGYWLEMLADAAIMPPKLLADLLREANEITAIAVASVTSALMLVTFQLLFGQPVTAETLDVLRLDILVFGLFDAAYLVLKKRRFVMVMLAVILGLLISGYQAAYTGTMLGTMRLVAFLIVWPFLNVVLMSAVVAYARRQRA